MRVVLDTNVFVSGLLVPESVPGRIVAGWRSAHYELALSEPLLEELGRGLSYPKISARLKWDGDAIAHFLLLLRFRTEIVDIAQVKIIVLRDLGDDPVLATLIASKADCLVSGDGDLLALRGKYPIVTPSEFARRMK